MSPDLFMDVELEAKARDIWDGTWKSRRSTSWAQADAEAEGSSSSRRTTPSSPPPPTPLLSPLHFAEPSMKNQRMVKKCESDKWHDVPVGKEEVGTLRLQLESSERPSTMTNDT